MEECQKSQMKNSSNHVLAWEIFHCLVGPFLTSVLIYYEQIQVLSSRRTVTSVTSCFLKGTSLLKHSLQPPWGLAVLKSWAPIIWWFLSTIESCGNQGVPWSQTKTHKGRGSRPYFLSLYFVPKIAFEVLYQMRKFLCFHWHAKITLS